jgi:DNA-binding NtrC family response regulator
MSSSTILTITKDDGFLSLLREQLRSQVGPAARMIVSSSMSDACSILKSVHPRLVVLHWTGESARYDQLDGLLWTTSVLARQTPVLVIAERYRIDQATMMYRMGVAEYISRTHHLEQLGQVFDAYLHPVTLATGHANSSAEAGEPSKAWAVSNHSSASLAARVV